MMQLVVSTPLPATNRLRQRCLLDPDVLLNLETEFRSSKVDVEELSDRFSLILNDLRMAGAWKRTKRQRLKQTEEMLCAHIPPQLRQDFLFLDIGASDGITTVEALRKIKQVFGDTARAYAADLNLWLLRYRRGPVVEYRASNGEPIMVRIGPLGLRLSKSRRGSAAPDYNPLVRLYLRLSEFSPLDVVGHQNLARKPDIAARARAHRDRARLPQTRARSDRSDFGGSRQQCSKPGIFFPGSNPRGDRTSARVFARWRLPGHLAECRYDRRRKRKRVRMDQRAGPVPLDTEFRFRFRGKRDRRRVAISIDLTFVIPGMVRVGKCVAIWCRV